MHNNPHTEEAKAKMRAARAVRPLKLQLPEEDIVERLLNSDATTRSLAEEFDCSDATIKKVLRKYTTKEQRLELKRIKQSASLRGYKHGEETRQNMSVAQRGENNAFFGREHSSEFKQSQSLRKKGKPTSDLHRKAVSAAQQGVLIEDWEGFKIDESKRARHSIEYKTWREAVFKRDDFTCRICGKRGGILHPHHIKPFSKYPELRYEVANGVTLCATPCHKSTLRREAEWEQKFKN